MRGAETSRRINNREPHMFHRTKIIIIITRFLLGGVFIVSGLQKIRFNYDFLLNVYLYQILGPRGGLVVAILLPWLELTTGIALTFGMYLRGAFSMAAAMACIFIVAQSNVLIYGISINCGCFGGNQSEVIGFASLARTSLVFGASVFGFIRCLHQYSERGVTSFVKYA